MPKVSLRGTSLQSFAVPEGIGGVSNSISRTRLFRFPDCDFLGPLKTFAYLCRHYWAVYVLVSSE